MRPFAALAVFLILSSPRIPFTRHQGQFGTVVNIVSPLPGEAVQGRVQVLGNTVVNGFLGYELAFAFRDDPTGTWFVIAQSTLPVEDGPLGEWDTTTLTDGFYTLRLTVQVNGAEPIIFIVPDLRVRNYSPIETNTPAPTVTLVPGVAPTATITPLPPTATPLPGNLAEITQGNLRAALVSGAVGGTLLLALLALYAYSRRR